MLAPGDEATHLVRSPRVRLSRDLSRSEDFKFGRQGKEGAVPGRRLWRVGAEYKRKVKLDMDTSVHDRETLHIGIFALCSSSSRPNERVGTLCNEKSRDRVGEPLASENTLVKGNEVSSNIEERHCDLRGAVPSPVTRTSRRIRGWMKSLKLQI
jgi:hypothetical protein